MKTAILLFIMLAVITDPARIGKVNRAKDAAKKAYLAGDYKTAVRYYQYLTDSLNVQEEEVLLNLAHAHFQLNDTSSAKAVYQRLTAGSTPAIRSTAQQQLGVLANRSGKTEEALTHFKEALKADPTNDDARYNYELVKKKLEEQKKKEQQQKDQQQNQDQKKQQNNDQKKDPDDKPKQDQQKSDQQKKDDRNKQDQQQTEQQQQEEQKKDEKKEDPSVSEKLDQLKISRERARMLLEAMKNQEMQYLQQNKRKPTKPKDKGKPDW